MALQQFTAGASGAVAGFSQRLKSPMLSSLQAAYCYYYVPGSLPYLALMKEALTCACIAGFDVFNALDIMQVGRPRAFSDTCSKEWVGCCGDLFLLPLIYHHVPV